MNDRESELLASTKQEFEQPKTSSTTQKPIEEIDVEALLRAQGFSKDTQHNSTNTKWVVLGVVVISLIIFMVVISRMLKGMS